MRKAIAICSFLVSVLMARSPLCAQNLSKPQGKDIYIPRELRDNDFTSPDSKWSYARMAVTDNFAVFWEKGFGDDLSKAPDLDGHNMKVDLDNLLGRLESFYAFYRDSLKFVLPGSKSECYRMMVMLNYSLEGTAYGGDYDRQIGALWIAPNRVQDKKLNCIAHELGHSFQSQVSCDGQGESWGGGGIFEMASQWMLWQVNPEWVTDENYHWEGFKQHINLPFLHGENIYHSPYVLEYWGMRRGLTVMAELFRHGRKGEDPAMTYMRLFGLSLDSFAEEMLDCYSRLVTFDFPRVKDSHCKYACELGTHVADAGEGWITPVEGEKLMTYGFNVIELPCPGGGEGVKVAFQAMGGDAEENGYMYKFVAVDGDGNAAYSVPFVKSKAQVVYKSDEGKEVKKLYLVVVGYPKNVYHPIVGNPYEQDKNEKNLMFDYKIKVM